MARSKWWHSPWGMVGAWGPVSDAFVSVKSVPCSRTSRGGHPTYVNSLEMACQGREKRASFREAGRADSLPLDGLTGEKGQDLANVLGRLLQPICSEDQAFSQVELRFPVRNLCMVIVISWPYAPAAPRKERRRTSNVDVI
jgi:hypothetical protein